VLMLRATVWWCFVRRFGWCFGYCAGVRGFMPQATSMQDETRHHGLRQRG
jgi:hypothetical protein